MLEQRHFCSLSHNAHYRVYSCSKQINASLVLSNEKQLAAAVKQKLETDTAAIMSRIGDDGFTAGFGASRYKKHARLGCGDGHTGLLCRFLGFNPARSLWPPSAVNLIPFRLPQILAMTPLLSGYPFPQAP